MAKKMLIDATHAEETRVVVVDGNKVDEFDFESLNKRQLAGNIYLAKVTRVEPSLQAAFVDYGGNRHGFLAFSEIHPDYYQIPTADREALLAEEAEYNRQIAEAELAEDIQSSDSDPDVETETLAEVIPTDAAFGPVVDLSEEEPADLVEVPEEDADTAAETPADADEDALSASNIADGTDEEDRGDQTATLDDEADARLETSEVVESASDTDTGEDAPRLRKPRPRRYKIQEVIKTRQILLVQVVKEERGNKGAALTTYLSLAGRYCVLMPNTARGGGISRKITNAADRKKLKSIASEIEVPQGAGLIIRTAGAKRSKPEIKRDYEYLIRQWEAIRDLTLKSIAPAPIYAEGDLIKRSIRDLYSKEIEEIIVEGQAGFDKAREYMKMLMPSHAKNVKHYKDPLPLFSRYQVETYLTGMFNPTVQLKSGGYLVIGVTEALVAIDVNSGRSTKEGSVEDTALKTNLEAAEEVARQLRLRDLAGLVVIDFIDMEERRNNASVEKRLKEHLKHDRARIQVGRISGFGLLEMSRQRLRPGMIEATTAPCPHCHGTGLVRSDDNQALSILREIEEEAVRQRSKEVLVKVPLQIANYMHNQKREHIAMIESRFGLSVRIEADLQMISPNFEMERFKTATRIVAQPDDIPVVSIDSVEAEEFSEDVALSDEEEEQPKKRRRRRGGKGRGQNGEAQTVGEAQSDDATGASDGPSVEATADDPNSGDIDTTNAPADADHSDATPEAEKTPSKRRRAPKSRKPKADSAAKDTDASAEQTNASEDAAETAESKPVKARRTRSKKKAEAPEQEQMKVAATGQSVDLDSESIAEPTDDTTPKRRGWWSMRG
ncbi:MAG: Rne/Rng family ribonuclease [Pseudomonadota bacterium]